MAIVTGPLQSFDASGKLANSIVFSKWKGRNYVRRLAIPSNPKSQAQLYFRAFMAFLGSQWSTLSGALQAEWDADAAAYLISSFNAYTRQGMREATQTNAPYQAASVIGGTASVLGALTATGGVGILSLSQAVTTANDGWGCGFLIRSGSTPGGDVSFIRAVQPHSGASAVTAVIRGLAPATWYAQGISFSDGGTYGAASAVQSDVVT